MDKLNARAAARAAASAAAKARAATRARARASAAARAIAPVAAAVAAYAAYELAVAAHRPNGTPALSPGRLFILIVLSVAALLYRLSQNHAAAAGGGGSNFAAYRAGQAQLDPSQTGSPPDHIRYEHERLDVRAMEERSSDFLRMMQSRRTIRFISKESFPRAILDRCIEAAATAPSGAHCQPWHFAVVETAELKSSIRTAVELEEKINYERRMAKQWVSEVEGMVGDLPTAYTKPYLTDAPYVVVLFKKKFDFDAATGEKVMSRYAEESAGIAAGIFLAALQAANLVTLTSTPMGSESKIRTLLNRPPHEKVFLLLPVGWPASIATVPYRSDAELRKSLGTVMSSH